MTLSIKRQNELPRWPAKFGSVHSKSIGPDCGLSQSGCLAEPSCCRRTSQLLGKGVLTIIVRWSASKAMVNWRSYVSTYNMCPTTSVFCFPNTTTWFYITPVFFDKRNYCLRKQKNNTFENNDNKTQTSKQI